jgi:hypothetical protein
MKSTRDAIGQLDKDDPKIAYMGPENGPFRCDECRFFKGDNKPCSKVRQPVKAHGCCNKFKP